MANKRKAMSAARKAFCEHYLQNRDYDDAEQAAGQAVEAHGFDTGVPHGWDVLNAAMCSLPARVTRLIDQE